MEREPSTLNHSANAFDDRNDFLHLLLGMVAVSRAVIDLFGGNPDTGDPEGPAEARAAAAPSARELLR